jgi:hypothetical protein
VTASLIAKTTQNTPTNAAQWSARTMAREMSISKASVSRIWQANGLKPHRVESFKVSNDPQFADKLEAIVGLYLNPPEHALVCRWTRKVRSRHWIVCSPACRSKRGAAKPWLMTTNATARPPCSPRSTPQTARSMVYASRSVAIRNGWSSCTWSIKRPADKEIYLICDNYSTHKHERMRRWLGKHKRLHVRLTPTSASWLNMVERFFRNITKNRLRRGVFQDLEHLMMAIGEYIDGHHQNLKPFIWTAKANDIWERVTRAQTTLNKGRSAWDATLALRLQDHNADAIPRRVTESAWRKVHKWYRSYVTRVEPKVIE